MLVQSKYSDFYETTCSISSGDQGPNPEASRYFCMSNGESSKTVGEASMSSLVPDNELRLK